MVATRRKRRSLNDLYVRGTPVQVTAPDGVVVIWLQKLDPLDHDMCVKKAKAARARARSTYQDQESDEYLELLDTVYAADRDTLIDQIVAPEQAKVIESATAEMSMGEDSEWAKDGYLDGLYEAWNTGVREAYEEDPDDPEALRILAEFKRFDEELENALKPELDRLVEQYADVSDAQLRERAVEALIDRQLQEAWLDEFVRCEIWLASREPCEECYAEIDEAIRRRDAGEPPVPNDQQHQAPHEKYHFVDRKAVDRLHKSIREQLEATYLGLTVDPTEGKDSPGIGASYGSSDLSAPEETAPSSGPVGAPA